MQSEGREHGGEQNVQAGRREKVSVGHDREVPSGAMWQSHSGIRLATLASLPTMASSSPQRHFNVPTCSRGEQIEDQLDHAGGLLNTFASTINQEHRSTRPLPKNDCPMPISAARITCTPNPACLQTIGRWEPERDSGL